MNSEENICAPKREFDDSGCVQDVSTQHTMGQVNLLDFSDDVLLCILRHCNAPDLKAIAHSCIRLGRLVRERSLWRHVDARTVPCSRARFRWYIDNVLHSDTRTLKLYGYAKFAKGCVGLINILRKESLEPNKNCFQAVDGMTNEITICGGFQEIPTEIIEREPPEGERQNARYFISTQRPHLPRHRCCMSWPDDGVGRLGPHSCSGPQFTMSPELFRQLGALCPHLTTLNLDYCNIDSNSTGVALFPNTVTKLSLRGSKCYNVTFDRSFVYKIQDQLPLLMSLDVSECEWMEPAALLPLSKMTLLEELFMQDCYKMSEFVAYASLTARYGFKTLKSLDLRGSPVGDSEVSALGWLPNLEKLWLCARGVRRARPHAHYADDERTEHSQLDPWEVAGLEYNSLVHPETSTENTEINSEDESASSSKNDVPAEDDESTKDNKRKSKDSKMNGEPSRKRRKVDGKKDDKQNKETADAYKAIGVISINGLRRALGIDNQQNQNNEETQDVGVANAVIPPLDGVHVNLTNDIGINMPPVENKNDKENNAETKKVENEENAKTNDENTNNTGTKRVENAKTNDVNDNKDKVNNENDKDEKNDQASTRERSEDLPVVHPPAECVIDCIKIDQMHDAKTKRGRPNEVLLIASTTRKHRLPRIFPDYDRVHVKRNRDPVVVEIRPHRVYTEQNAVENRPGPSNEGVANNNEVSPERTLEPYLRFTNDNNNSNDNVIGLQDFLLPPEEFQLKLQQMDQEQMRKPPVKTEEKQKSEQIKVEKEEIPEQVQNQNRMETEQAQNQEQAQKIEKIQPSEQEPMQVEEQKQSTEQKTQKLEPVQIDEEKQHPEKPKPKREKRKQKEQKQKSDKKEKHKKKPEKENPGQMERPVLEGQRPDQGPDNGPQPQPIQYQVEPRHHVLYVGVGPQLNTYRFPRDASELIRHVNYGPTHVDSRSLVTDFALRRFGRAEGDVNIIHLDPNGPVPVGQSSGSRPDRSNLRLLSVNGYRNVTDRSLVHLATAAPNLEYVDFTGTNVSANGVEVFKGLNPDCVFVHSPFDEME